jgi:hypothetical protein
MQDPEYDAGQALQRGDEHQDWRYEHTYGEVNDVAGLTWHTLTSDYDEDMEPGDPVDTIEEGQDLTLVAYPPAMVGPDPVGMLMFNVSVPPREMMVTEFNVELQEIFVCPSKRGEPGYAHALALGCVYVLSELLAVANTKAARGSSVYMWLSHEPFSETADRIASRIHTELGRACTRLQAQRRRDGVAFGVDLEFS